MMIFTITLLCLMVVSLVFFLVANQDLIGLRKEFANLAKQKGISVDQKTLDINRMRSLDSEISSEQSKELLVKAENAVKSYLVKFRIFLFFMIVGSVIAVFSKF